MTRILHLSDLHFGRDRPELVEPLLERIEALAPDLVAISGDFTQRARVHQFASARAFVDRIGAPTLSVPGNHDTPLDHVILRMLRPWARYRRAIDTDLEPEWTDEDAIVAGVNTVNRFRWQSGRIGRQATARVCTAFEDAGDKLRVAVMHHPLEHGPDVDKKLMRGSAKALAAFERCGADVVLSGHLHSTVAAPFDAAEGLLFVQAGTGLSNRLRGERNTFNLLTGTRDAVTVETYEAGDDLGFAVARTARFHRGPDGRWSAADQVDVEPPGS